jgi:polysaccharide pyruvyl transferase WcaK-like protein
MNIGLLDHMGYGNLGDAATQDVVIANIKKRLPDARLIGFSLIPEDTAKRHGIPCHPIWWRYPRSERGGIPTTEKISLKSILKSALKKNPLVYRWAKPVSDFAREVLFCVRSYRILRSLDVLIISGGGQFDDLWHGPWLQPYTLFKFSLLTKIARKKLYLLNVGAGRLEHPLSQFFARWAVRFADYRSFRDRDSQDRIRKLGVKAATEVYPDAVYALEVEKHLKGAIPASPRLVVGLNPTGFCDPRIWPRKIDSLYQAYLDKLVLFSAWLLDQGYTLRLFTTDFTNDRLAIEDLKAGLGSKLSSPELAGLTDPIFRNASESVKDVLQEMSEFDFVVTSKFHGIIFSHLLRKPVISLSYQRKMDVAMQAVAQGDFAANIEHFDVDWLIRAFNSLVHQSRTIRSRSAGAVEANAARLSQQFDSLFLPDNP